MLLWQIISSSLVILLKPQELLNNPVGVLFTTIEECSEEIQYANQPNHFSPVSHFLTKYNKKLQVVLINLFNIKVTNHTLFPRFDPSIKAFISN
jgi:hypothetical protein